MIRSVRLFFITAFCLICFVGCGNQDDFVVTSGTSPPGTGDQSGSGNDNTGPVSLGLPELQARVVLPNGANFDFTNTFLLSQLISYPVEQDGTSTVISPGEGRLFAALFDADEQPLLFGFVTADSPEVSVATTVEATIFMGLNIHTMPIEVQELFWQNVRIFPNFDTTVSEAEALFLSDPNFFTGTAYRELMQAYLIFLDSGAVAPRLDIQNNHERSGVFLEEQPGEMVKVVNTLRRRCHAFLYKISSTDNSDQTTTLINNIRAENPIPTRDLPVGPTSAYDSFVGTNQTAASGKGIEFFRVESDPLDLGLSADEKEAVWKVRIIGPSIGLAPLSATEESKLRELELRTIALDWLLPTLFKLASADDFLVSLENDPQLKRIANDAIAILATLPSIEGPLSKHDLGGIIQSIKDGVLDGTLKAQYLPIYQKVTEYIATKSNLQGNALSSFNANANKFNLYIKITDIILEINSYKDLIKSVLVADMLEEFDAVTTRGKVSLSPLSGIALQGEGEDFTAEVQDAALEGAVFQYTWYTSGQYGELRDGQGKTGSTFVTSQKTVEFYADPGISIPEGTSAVDIVKVEVAIKDGGMLIPVGEKTVSVVIREIGFELTPQNIELEGGDSITLEIQRTDESDPTLSEFFDYKFVWETQGEFGFFNATTSSVTSTSSSQVNYTCLDEENEGTEEITVRVYCRPKGSSDPYLFVDRLRVSIEIINDPQIEIIYVDRFTRYKILPNNDLGANRYIVRHAFAVPRLEGAIDYNLRIVTWKNSTANYLGRGASWNDDDASRLDDNEFMPFHENHFIYEPSPGSSVLGDERGQEQIGKYDGITGLAKVKIRVMPP